jgi:hypothetical protein
MKLLCVFWGFMDISGRTLTQILCSSGSSRVRFYCVGLNAYRMHFRPTYENLHFKIVKQNYGESGRERQDKELWEE